jgi:ankyrin repeat protein
MRAAESGRNDQIACLLAHGADPGSEVDGETALKLAELAGQEGAVKLLRKATESG